MFSLKDLSCVVAVYEHGGFARAARVLSTVQSNVSARVLRLERLIGAPLFVRLHRGTVPTAKGELLYRHALKVLREVGELETVLKGATPDGQAGSKAA